MLKYFSAFFLLPILLMGSNIPIYIVSDNAPNLVQLTDGSVYTTDGFDILNWPNWETTDRVILCRTESVFGDGIVLRNGLPTTEPRLLLINITKGSTTTGYLKVLSTAGLVLHISGFSPDGTIQLNDGTSWKVAPLDRRFLSVWTIGDRVHIGRNFGIDQQSFDAVIVNQDKLGIAHAIEE